MHSAKRAGTWTLYIEGRETVRSTSDDMVSGWLMWAILMGGNARPAGRAEVLKTAILFCLHQVPDAKEHQPWH